MKIRTLYVFIIMSLALVTGCSKEKSNRKTLLHAQSVYHSINHKYGPLRKLTESSKKEELLHHVATTKKNKQSNFLFFKTNCYTPLYKGVRRLRKDIGKVRYYQRRIAKQESTQAIEARGKLAHLEKDLTTIESTIVDDKEYRAEKRFLHQNSFLVWTFIFSFLTYYRLVNAT